MIPRNSLTVCHITSAHSRYDVRIFLKQCRSLVKSGYRVNLVVADGRGDEVKDGVHILDAGLPKPGRLRRFTVTARAVVQRAIQTNAALFHLHDPELMPYGMKLKKRGCIVIFDAHEDLPRQILSKHYLSRSLASLLAKAVAVYERRATSRFNAVVAATPFIRDKFLKINPSTIDVNNFPILEELAQHSKSIIPKCGVAIPQVCYVGAVSVNRGIYEMVQAIRYVQAGVRLVIAGDFSQESVASKIRTLQGWKRVDHLGWLERSRIKQVLHESIAGLVTLHPTENYVDALPIKMFEYMAAGIPVIASDFDLWRRIVQHNECGLCVNPLESKEISNAIDYIAAHPTEARRMGANGRRAVERDYNWENESTKLVELYTGLSALEQNRSIST